jgi:hypothetical protein
MSTVRQSHIPSPLRGWGLYALGGIVYLVHSTRIFKIPFGQVLNYRVAGRIVLLLLPGILLGIHHYRSSPGGIWEILVQAGLYGTVYGLLAVRYAVDDYDLEKISAVIPPVRHLSILRR